MSSGAWSAVAGIASAVAAVVALIVAFRSLEIQRQALRDQLAERENQQSKELRAQADLVSTWSESLLTAKRYEEVFQQPPDPPRDPSWDRWRPVVVLNASESPIYEVETWLYQPKLHHDERDTPVPPSRSHFTYRSVVVPKVPFRVDRAVPGRGLKHPPDTGVKFRDLSGNVWWRDFSGTLYFLSS